MVDCKRWGLPSGELHAGKCRPRVVRHDGTQAHAYRIVYEQAHGPIPAGHVLHHTCRTEWCVELEHLLSMTRGDHQSLHTQDAGRNHNNGESAKTHCKRGHPYSKENTYVRKKQGGTFSCRECRRCGRARDRRRRAALAAAREAAK